MDELVKWDIPPESKRRMHEIARNLRQRQTLAETALWQSIRNKKLDGRKFRRQVPIGAFVVDFYCAAERLAVEVDGPVHDNRQEADRLRQELIEELGIRFVRLKNYEIEYDMPSALNTIRRAFHD